MIDLKFIGRSFDQICFVVPDLEKAMDYWRNTNGVQAWSVVYDLAKTQIEKEYLGRPGNFQFSCAYGYAGDTLIELARHDGGDSIYRDWVEREGTAFITSVFASRTPGTSRALSSTIGIWDSRRQ
jgi:hypothetical protein